MFFFVCLLIAQKFQVSTVVKALPITFGGSSRPEELPLQPLTEPCLIVSHHTALVIQIYTFH